MNNDKNFEKAMKVRELDRALQIMVSTMETSVAIAEKHKLTWSNPYYVQSKCVLHALESWRPVSLDWLERMARAAEEIFPDPWEAQDRINVLPTPYSFQEWAEIVERCAQAHNWKDSDAARDWQRKIDIALCDLEWPYSEPDPRIDWEEARRVFDYAAAPF